MKLNLEDINKAFESKARLGIMSVLLVNESIDFVSLKYLLELTDGNLASHTRNLEELGYIRSYKQFIGRKPNTTFSVTPEGKEAFKKHLNALENFLKNQPIFKKDLNCCADCAKIQRNAILRTRQPGDFFRPAGRHLRKTLKKYYNELGIPQAERPLLPLLADGSEVLWLWGCGFAEGCAPDEYTHEVLTVRTEKTGEA